MQFLGLIISLAITALPTVNAVTATIAFDPVYDNTTQSTLTIACSDGTNGFYTKGYKTLGDIPSFPYIGAAFSIPGWNSPNCGKCYQLTYGDVSINVTALDVSTDGFVLSKTAMDDLTGGLASKVGRIDGDWVEVDASGCGL
ncbi:hypothetical protein RUND412_004672 [Rhizina undulata]